MTDEFKKPTKEEYEKFIEVFDKLASFEAQSRLVRGYGCFVDEEIPVSEVVLVLNWLSQEFY